MHKPRALGIGLAVGMSLCGSVMASGAAQSLLTDEQSFVSYTVKQELEDYPIDNDELNVTASLSF
jgi:hypothetical protein